MMKLEKLPALMLLVIGIGFLIASTARIVDTVDLIHNAQRVDGVVIVTPKHAKSHPRVEYTTVDGKKRWLLANEWVTGFRPFQFKDGQNVKVLYDPANVSRFSIDDYLSLHGISVVGLLISALFLNLGRKAFTGMTVINPKNLTKSAPLFLLWIVFLTIGFVEAHYARVLIGKSIILDGVVSETPHGGSHPRVTYIEPSGETGLICANGSISGYKDGEHVRVVHNPENPSDSQIDDFGSIYKNLNFGYGWNMVVFILAIGFLYEPEKVKDEDKNENK